MPKSTIFHFLSQKLGKSYFLSYLYDQVDVNEPLKYQSLIASSLSLPISVANRLIDYVGAKTIFSWITEHIDLKSVVIFVFIVTITIFPGYGAEDTGITLVPGSPSAGLTNQYGITLSHIAFAVALALLFFIFVKDLMYSKRFSFSMFEVVLFFFIICLEISSLFSQNISISFIWLREVMLPIAVYFIFSRLIIKKSQMFYFCIGLLSLIYIESIIILIQFLLGGFIGLPIETAQGTTSSILLYLNLNGSLLFRPTGTLAHSNTIPFLFALALPMSLTLIANKSKFIRIAYIFSIFLSLAASFISLSRWGTTTLLFSLMLIALIVFNTKIKMISTTYIFRVTFVLLIATLVIFTIKYDIFARFLSFSFTDTSLSTRIQLIIQSIYVFFHNPLFGIGGGNFTQYLIYYDFTPLQVAQYFPAPVHNFYFLLLSETGTISFSLFLACLVYLFLYSSKFLRTVFRNKNYANSLLILGLLISILVYLFNGLWEIRSLDQRLLSILFWMNIGLFFNITRIKTHSNT